jgi:hypothetical protein
LHTKLRSICIMRKIIVYVMWALLGIFVLATGLAFYAIN